MEGTCSCHEGYQGTSCDIAVCPSKSMFDECSGHGACVLSHLTNETTGDKAVPKCFCEEGFTGSDCSLLGCDEECESNGDAVCRNGVCYCKPGMGGDHCTRTLCERDCHGHGACQHEGLCDCEDGWRGKHCDKKTCTKQCNALDGGVVTGVCESDRCKCLPGVSHVHFVVVSFFLLVVCCCLLLDLTPFSLSPLLL